MSIRKLKPIVCQTQTNHPKIRKLKPISVMDPSAIQLSNYTFGDFVALDFETANFNSDICQIGLCIVKNFEVIERYSTYVQPPNNQYHPQHTKIHGISAKTTKNAKNFKEVWPEVYDKLKNQVIVCHNAKTADINWLHKSLKQFEIELPKFPFIDTCRLAYVYVPLPKHQRSGQYKLNALCERFSIEQKQHHDASDDAYCCAKLLLTFIEKYNIHSYAEIKENKHAYDEFPEYLNKQNSNNSIKQKQQKENDNIEAAEETSSESILPISSFVVFNWLMARGNLFHIDLCEVENLEIKNFKSWLIRPKDLSIYYAEEHAQFFSFRDLAKAPKLEWVYKRICSYLNNKTVMLCRDRQNSFLTFVQYIQNEQQQIFDANIMYSFNIFKKVFDKKTMHTTVMQYKNEDFEISTDTKNRLGKHYNSNCSSELMIQLLKNLNVSSFNELQDKYKISIEKTTNLSLDEK